MGDGRSVSKLVLAVRGTADNPMSQGEVEAKAFDLIGSVLGARRAKAILRAIGGLETVPGVVALPSLWQPRTTEGAALPLCSRTRTWRWRVRCPIVFTPCGTP